MGWGSLEYGPPPGFTGGQVRGGRWKPLHYFYRAALMRDVFATCGALSTSQNGTSACYVSNHQAGLPFKGTVTLTGYDHFAKGASVTLIERPVQLVEGPGALSWFTAQLPAGNGTSIVATVHDDTGAVMSEHMVQLVKPQEMRVPEAKLTFKVADAANADGTIDVSVTSDQVALWVTLTTLAQGRFSDNVFLLPATTRVVQFIPFSPSTAASDLALLKSSLRIEDFSMYRPLA